MTLRFGSPLPPPAAMPPAATFSQAEAHSAAARLRSTVLEMWLHDPAEVNRGLTCQFRWCSVARSSSNQLALRRRAVNLRKAPALMLMCFLGAIPVSTAAQDGDRPAGTAVPRLVKFSGRVGQTSKSVPADAATGAQTETLPAAKPAPATSSVTFAIHAEQEGGAALWQETQNVALDAEGRYSVLLGAASREGLPAELFGSGEPRWLSVRVNVPGDAEA